MGSSGGSKNLESEMTDFQPYKKSTCFSRQWFNENSDSKRYKNILFQSEIRGEYCCDDYNLSKASRRLMSAPFLFTARTGIEDLII